MYLDAVSTVESIAAPVASNGNGHHAEVFEPWAAWGPSPISHHGGSCCEVAREWLANTDHAVLNGGSIYAGPRWLRQRFDWGPSIYPLFWCEVLKKPKLDCGVHAALAYEAFIQRGVRAFRLQLVQQFTASAAASWHTSWTNEDAITAWLNDEHIYHEGCAILTSRGRLKLWDPTAGWWIDPKSITGYGSVLAVRIAARENLELTWGEHPIETNRWISLGRPAVRAAVT